MLLSLKTFIPICCCSSSAATNDKLCLKRLTYEFAMVQGESDDQCFILKYLS